MMEFIMLYGLDKEDYNVIAEAGYIPSREGYQALNPNLSIKDAEDIAEYVNGRLNNPIWVDLYNELSAVENTIPMIVDIRRDHNIKILNDLGLPSHIADIEGIVRGVGKKVVVMLHVYGDELDFINVMRHELTHARQILDGRLIMRDNGICSFDGVDYQSLPTDHEDYSKQPWELEAVKAQLYVPEWAKVIDSPSRYCLSDIIKP